MRELYSHLQRREAVEQSAATNRSVADRMGRSNFRNYRGTGKTSYPRSVHFADHVSQPHTTQQGRSEEERPSQERRLSEGGSRGGRGRGAFGTGGLRSRDPSWASANPNFLRDNEPDKPCHLNRSISNAQAEWLKAENRCFHCYRTLTACRTESKPCSMKGKSQALDTRLFPDAPAWN